MNDTNHAAMAASDAAEMRAVVSRWLSTFEAGLAAGDAKAIAALCESDVHWRDLLAFTWHITPRVGAEAIASHFVERQPAVKASGFEISTGRTPPRRVKRVRRECTEAIVRFATSVGRCEGRHRLPP